MTFGRKGLSRLDDQQVEMLALGYLTAAEEIEALVDTIKQRLADPGVSDRDNLNAWHKFLFGSHTRILTLGRQLPPPNNELHALAKEAESMEEEISQIAEALWGYDEARVSGLLLASGVLNTNA